MTSIARATKAAVSIAACRALATACSSGTKSSGGGGSSAKSTGAGGSKAAPTSQQPEQKSIAGIVGDLSTLDLCSLPDKAALAKLGTIKPATPGLYSFGGCEIDVAVRANTFEVSTYLAPQSTPLPRASTLRELRPWAVSR